MTDSLNKGKRDNENYSVPRLAKDFKARFELLQRTAEILLVREKRINSYRMYSLPNPTPDAERTAFANALNDIRRQSSDTLFHIRSMFQFKIELPYPQEHQYRMLPANISSSSVESVIAICGRLSNKFKHSSVTGWIKASESIDTYLSLHERLLSEAAQGEFEHLADRDPQIKIERAKLLDDTKIWIASREDLSTRLQLVQYLESVEPHSDLLDKERLQEREELKIRRESLDVRRRTLLTNIKKLSADIANENEMDRLNHIRDFLNKTVAGDRFKNRNDHICEVIAINGDSVSFTMHLPSGPRIHRVKADYATFHWTKYQE